MINEQDDTLEVEDIFEEVDEEGNDATDWKALALHNQGIAKRLKTKLEKSKEVKESIKAERQEEQPKGLDRLDKAILRVEKITEVEEVSLVEAIMKETGRDVESVLASKYFQSELKELREAQATRDATPSNSKRANQTARNEVEYWLEKDTLPEDQSLRFKVVNAKIAREKEKNHQFSDTAVIS